MKNTRPSQQKIAVLILATLIIGTACLCNPASLLTVTATTTPAPTPWTPSLSSPPVVSSLNASGPWLLMSTENGLWAANQDGSGLTQLTQEQFWQSGLENAVQPGGNLVAVLNSSGDRYHGLTLNLISLPDGSITKSIPLTSASTEPTTDSMPGETSIEAVRAISDNISLAWSPDGTKLAFIGVMDGPTAEVYLYDLTSDTTRRVSTDDAQDFSPAWSPDGAYILYFGADAFGTGAGYVMRGVWTASGDGSNVTMLFETDTAGVQLIGWRNAGTAVLTDWTIQCGPENLRLYNIVTTQSTVLEPGCVRTAAAGHWGTTTDGVLYSTDSGTYLLASDKEEVTKFDDRQASFIKWDSAGYMFAIQYADGNMTTLSPDASYVETAPVPSEDEATFGMIWAWTNQSSETPGLWVWGPGIEVGQIFDQPAYLPIWDTTNNTLFFFSNSELGTSLQRSTFAAYYGDTTEVAQLDMPVRGVTWVGMK